MRLDVPPRAADVIFLVEVESRKSRLKEWRWTTVLTNETHDVTKLTSRCEVTQKVPYSYIEFIIEYLQTNDILIVKPCKVHRHTGCSCNKNSNGKSK